jgi:hypothetical protein
LAPDSPRINFSVALVEGVRVLRTGRRHHLLKELADGGGEAFTILF